DDVENKFNDVCEHFDPKNKHPRPRTLKTLRQYFEKDLKKNKYSKADIEKIIKLMIDRKKIEVTDKQKEKIKWLI
ncbi:MAG: hypothetical protein LBG74_02675, partial [Spirochaetaceae bacterium]|nr:hypothetical protein [Spirochaetaceae bacterium]